MIFQYGAFSEKSTLLVSNALRYLSVSLFFVASYRIVVQSFYAMKDMKTPVYIAFFAFIINAISNYLCVYIFHFDIIGISISSVIANIVSFVILYILLMKKMNMTFSLNNGKINTIKTLFSSIIMAMAVYSLRFYILRDSLNSARIIFIIKVFVVIFIGVIIYTISNVILKNEDFISIFNLFKKRMVKK